MMVYPELKIHIYYQNADKLLKIILLEQFTKKLLAFFSFSNEKYLILEYKGILNGYKVSQSLQGIC